MLRLHMLMRMHANQLASDVLKLINITYTSVWHTRTRCTQRQAYIYYTHWWFVWHVELFVYLFHFYFFLLLRASNPYYIELEHCVDECVIRDSRGYYRYYSVDFLDIFCWYGCGQRMDLAALKSQTNMISGKCGYLGTLKSDVCPKY